MDVSGRIAYFTEKSGVNARGEWKRKESSLSTRMVRFKLKVGITSSCSLEVASPGDEVIVTNLALEIGYC